MIIDGIDVGSVDFGNTEIINKNIITNTNPNGGVFVFRNNTWPTNDIRTYRCLLSEATKESIIDSIIDNIGKEIEITDHLGNDYTAILLRPDVTITALRSGTCRGKYDVEFQFLITGTP